MGESILGRRFFRILMSLTYSGQLVLGTNVEECLPEIGKLKQRGIRPMLMVPTETTAHSSEEDA